MVSVEMEREQVNVSRPDTQLRSVSCVRTKAAMLKKTHTKKKPTKTGKLKQKTITDLQIDVLS